MELLFDSSILKLITRLKDHSKDRQTVSDDNLTNQVYGWINNGLCLYDPAAQERILAFSQSSLHEFGIEVVSNKQFSSISE